MEIIKDIIIRRREDGSIRDLLEQEVSFLINFKEKLHSRNVSISVDISNDTSLLTLNAISGQDFVSRYLEILSFEGRFAVIQKLHTHLKDLSHLTRLLKTLNDKFVNFIETVSDNTNEFINIKGILVKLGNTDLKCIEVLNEVSHLSHLETLTKRYQSKGILKVLPSSTYKLKYAPNNGSYYLARVEGDVQDIFFNTNPKIDAYLFDILPTPIFEKVHKHVTFTEKHGLDEFILDFNGRTFRTTLRKELNYESEVEIVGETIDITSVRKSEEVNRRLAYFDTLTGLANRELFTDSLDRNIAESIESKSDHFLSVLFIDVDDFKSINDTYGHDTGDEVLKEVASRLQECIRQGDIACRYAGDEFTVLCRNLKTSHDLEQIVQRITAIVTGNPVVILNRKVPVSLSVGIAVFPLDADNSSDLLKCADLAMYESKKNGKNRYSFYTQHMRAEELKLQEMKLGLSNALQRDELFLEYMVQYNSEKAKITGVESLLRWNHPTDGVLPAASFIPVAESSGLILQMGYWALRKGCEDLKILHDSGYPDITLSVNFSSLQFRQKDLLEMISTILEETGVAPEYLMIEISESTSMLEATRSSQILDALTDLGIRICLDDFGTGYSNMASLSQFKLSTLKLDKSIITELNADNNKHTLDLIRRMIILGRTFNAEVMSEGVETQAQYEILQGFGCTQFQGYYFGKPKCLSEVLMYLKDLDEEKKIKRSTNEPT